MERVNRAVEKLNLQLQLSEEQGTGSAFGYIQSGPLRNALQASSPAALALFAPCALIMHTGMPRVRSQVTVREVLQSAAAWFCSSEMRF